MHGVLGDSPVQGETKQVKMRPYTSPKLCILLVHTKTTTTMIIIMMIIIIIIIIMY